VKRGIDSSHIPRKIPKHHRGATPREQPEPHHVCFFLAAFDDDQGSLARFNARGQAASALNHPNIITIHDIVQAAGPHFRRAKGATDVADRRQSSDGYPFGRVWLGVRDDFRNYLITAA
jgi:hypothetical protein